jgi:uncharacterized protein (DUF58 family)
MSLRHLLSYAAPKARPEFTPVRRRPAFDLSLTGLVYALLMMFMGLAAVNTQASLLFGVFGLMIGILLVSVSISRVTLKHVRVVREMPEAGAVGVPLTITYHFENLKRFWPTISLTLAELDGTEGFTRQPQAYLLHAAAGAEVSVPVVVMPKRRGVYTLRRTQVSTSFPFGFIKRAVERSPTDVAITPAAPATAEAGTEGGRPRRRRWWRDVAGNAADTLVVYPPIGRVDQRVLTQCQPAETTGSTMRPRRGGSDELYGLKEFQHGESPRLIHWRRSARTGVLVSREMTQASPPRLLLLVDTCRADDTRASYALVEEAIAMAASLANAALEQGLSVGAFAWAGPAVDAAGAVDGGAADGGLGGAGHDGWHGIPPTRGKRQRRDLMTLLARLPNNADHGPAELVVKSQEVHEQGSTAVLFTTTERSDVPVTDRIRGTFLTIVAGSQQARNWFGFPAGIRFDQSLPGDQEMEVRG